MNKANRRVNIQSANRRPGLARIRPAAQCGQLFISMHLLCLLAQLSGRVDVSIVFVQLGLQSNRQ